MVRTLCNKFGVNVRKVTRRLLGKVARWAAGRAGLQVVDAAVALLPAGCRPIPKHFYDVDPAVLRQVRDGNRAILHQAMQNWQTSNEQTGKHWFKKHDQWGTKSDYRIWHQSLFPFLNPRTVRTMIADLAGAALLVVEGDWCHPQKPVLAGAEQLALDLGKDFQQPRKIFPSSIESKSNSSKTKTARKTAISPRKAAVADFPLPEHREQLPEQAEHRDCEHDGQDVLHALPGELVTQWTDTKLPLAELVARHGADHIIRTWQEAEGFKNRVAGLRTLLAKASRPAPPMPPPPPQADDDTQPDWADNDTPAIDLEWRRKFQAPDPEETRRAWLKAHMSPELFARMEAEEC